MKAARLPERALWTGLCLCLVAIRSSYAAGYVGAAACAGCHPAQYEKQTASNHFHSLRPIQGSIIGAILTASGHSPDGRLQYQRVGDTIALHENGFSGTATLEWAFGAGAQGSTAVGHLDGQFFEHRFSYYSRIHGLAPTFGHPPLVTTPIAELGVLQDNRTIFTCFNCHATSVRLGQLGPDLRKTLPGVQCERCHGPGSSHIAAVKSGATPAAVRKELVNPGRLPVKAQIEICGQCHRLPTPDIGDEPELENPVDVRFAPIGILTSRCFRVSGTLSCLTCHDPHENARPRASGFYSGTCLSCHENDRTPVRLCRRLQKQNCLPCHMKLASLGPNLRFTDHRIRIY